MNGYWVFRTRYGVASVRQLSDGRYGAFWDDENLGSYLRPGQAAEDLAGGSTHWPSSGVNPGTLGIPDDLSDWTFQPYR